MSFQRNILLVYIVQSLGWVRFFLPVFALFYIASNVTLQEFSIILSVFALTILLLEVPSGVFADIMGKKNALLLSRMCYIIEIAILAFGYGFVPFLIAKVISGIGWGLGSGTTSALLYDTLKVLDRTSEHKRISGNRKMIENFTMAGVFIIGGFLFSLDPKLPAIASLPFCVLGFLLTMLYVEPYPNVHKKTMRKAFDTMNTSWNYFIHHKELVAITLYSVPFVATISVLHSFSSSYFEVISLPLTLIGFIAFIGSVLTALGAKYAAFIEKQLGMKLSLTFIYVLAIFNTGLLIPLFTYIGAAWYLIILFGNGVFLVLINHYLNERVITEQRATMLSIKNMFDQLGIFLLFPLFGYLVGNFSYRYGFGLLFVLLLLGIAIYSFTSEESFLQEQDI